MAAKQDDFLEDNLIGDEILPANPWFQTDSGYVEFVKFQYAIEALGRYTEVLDDSLHRFLAEERAAFERKDYLQRVPDGWRGEAELVAGEGLGNLEDAMPHFAFGSTLALCFMLLEQLLKDLIALTEMRKGLSFKRFPYKRGEPDIERTWRFLAESWRVSLEVDEETSHELKRLRAMRNKFIHAASKELYPGTISEPAVSVTREDIATALTMIGSHAWVLERGLEASQGE
jgi:hypothetical protein